MLCFQEFRLPSTDGQHSLHVCSWSPETAPRGVIQLSHGIAEYVARYDAYARFLAQQGFYVLGNDHLGYGETAENPAQLGYPGEDGAWLHMVDDLYTVYSYARGLYPGLPYVLLGHSMGSFLARSFLLRYPQALDGCILSGTGQTPTPVVKAGSLLAGFLKKQKGGDSRLPLIQSLCFGGFNKRISSPRTAYDWLSRDSAQVDAYIADPLCGMDASTSMACELLFGLQYIWNKKNLQKLNPHTPLYLYAGEEDPVGQYGKGVRQVARRFQAMGCEDVTLRLYPECRHELHNELNRQELYLDTLHWLEQSILKEGAK